MPSRISQMRSGIQTPQQPQTQPQPQSQLNESIERVKKMMYQVKSAQNPQMELAQMIYNNPNTSAIANMLKSNGNLESIARELAAKQGIDIDQLINQLKSSL